MKKLKIFLLITVALTFASCNNNDDNNNNEESSSIEIGNYSFPFPNNFVLVDLEGIDSYVGNINGNGISLNFDYGWYTFPRTDLSPNDYVVTEDEINGHYRQIVKAINSENDLTSIHLYKISDAVNNPNNYNSLTISINNINSSEQNMIIDIFNRVEIID